MPTNIIKSKSFEFAVTIVDISKELIFRKEYVISKQLVKSGTAIGAIVREAHYAESKADFVHKMAMALKEANETMFWLELLQEAAILSAQSIDPLKANCEALIKILTKIINTTKHNVQK